MLNPNAPPYIPTIENRLLRIKLFGYDKVKFSYVKQCKICNFSYFDNEVHVHKFKCCLCKIPSPDRFAVPAQTPHGLLLIGPVCEQCFSKHVFSRLRVVATPTSKISKK